MAAVKPIKSYKEFKANTNKLGLIYSPTLQQVLQDAVLKEPTHGHDTWHFRDSDDGRKLSKSFAHHCMYSFPDVTMVQWLGNANTPLVVVCTRPQADQREIVTG